MTLDQAKIGTYVKNNISFAGVPIGTLGIIDEDYGTGIMVCWRPDSNYKIYDGKPNFVTGRLRDGFDKETELEYLDKVDNNELPNVPTRP